MIASNVSPDPYWFSYAKYRWPEGLPESELSFTRYREGPATVAMGILPHSCEPLGTAILPCLNSRPHDGTWGIVVIDSIDPPPPGKGRFEFNANFDDFLIHFYLPPVTEQVEFSHTDDPLTPSQIRAQNLRDLLRAQNSGALLLIHNDPFARFPYLYGNSPLPNVEANLYQVASRYFTMRPLPSVGWTARVSPSMYQFFSPTQICPAIKTNHGGIYMAEKLGIPIITLELPMFDWSETPEALTEKFKALYLNCWHYQLDATARRQLLSQEGLLPSQYPRMIDARINAQIQWSVLEPLGKLVSSKWDTK